MKRRQKFAWLLSGMMIAFLVVNMISPAVATALKTIQVSSNVKIFVDDVKMEPKDVNGNPVDVFIYNGTTYVPIRAVSQYLGKPVQWDGAARSVYIGEHNGNSPAVLLRNIDCFYSTGMKFTTSDDWKDNLGNMRDNVTCLYSGGSWYTNTGSQVYLLNGQYSALSGTLFQNYDYRSENGTNTLEIYGDGNLLYRATVSPGVYPVDFKVDVTRVLQLEIKLVFYGYRYNSRSTNYSRAGVADLGLWT